MGHVSCITMGQNDQNDLLAYLLLVEKRISAGPPSLHATVHPREAAMAMQAMQG